METKVTENMSIPRPVEGPGGELDERKDWETKLGHNAKSILLRFHIKITH
jgi:hypothetical protein